MTLQVLFLFTLTTALACFAPGPAALYATSVGALRSRGRLGYAIGGIAAANALYFGLSAVGIAGLLVSSPRLFTAIRWAGAGYLVWLGLQLVFARGAAAAATPTRPAEERALALFSKGFLIEFANPKALLYFSALLPQFVNSEAPLAPQFALFCLITVVLDMCAYSFYGAVGAGAARLSSSAFAGGFRRVAGAAFLLAGIRLAWT